MVAIALAAAFSRSAGRGRAPEPSGEHGGMSNVDPMSDYRASSQQDVSGWASGGITFAATVLAIVGTFQILDGLVDLQRRLLPRTENYMFNLDVLRGDPSPARHPLRRSGLGRIQRQHGAGVTAIVVASLSAIANFLFIPYHLPGSIPVIAFNFWVIWASHGQARAPTRLTSEPDADRHSQPRHTARPRERRRSRRSRRTSAEAAHGRLRGFTR